MKSVLLIGNDLIQGGTDEYYKQYIDFFSRSLKSRDEDKFEVVYTLLRDLYIEVGDKNFCVVDTKSNTDISTFDVIIIRGMGFREQSDVLKTISTYANIHKVRIINDYSKFRDFSKLMQATQFYENSLPVASTVYVNRAVIDQKHALPFDFPCVMKAVYGSHGNDNYVVQSIEDVVRIANNSTERFVLQRFVPNDGDYRILILGDEIRIIGRKATSDSHLNNTSQGGTSYLLQPDQVPKAMLEDAMRIVRVLDMSIAGVDAMIDSQTGEYSFLEVNSQPQLMSGSFTLEKEFITGSYLESLLWPEKDD